MRTSPLDAPAADVSLAATDSACRTSRGVGQVHCAPHPCTLRNSPSYRALGRAFHFGESKWFEVRGETFNLTNTPIFNSPASQTITSSLFGQIRSSQGERNVELAAKFHF